MSSAESALEVDQPLDADRVLMLCLNSYQEERALIEEHISKEFLRIAEGEVGVLSTT